MSSSSETSSCCTSPVTSTGTGEIDASCRWPVFTLLGGAAFWLALSSVFGLIASLKFHGPGILSNCPWLTYGRVYPAWSNLLVYGFCIPAGLAMLLWILARLARVPLVSPLVAVIGAKLWHIGVLVGLIGILAGDSTGYEWFEMPRYAAVILFAAFVMIAACGFVTHHARAEGSLYPSQWFALASLFWFPWIYSTAILLLLKHPVRGMAQASIAWWFSGNLLVVWLVLTGLAATFYFLPKLAQRPLHSPYLALFAFLTLALFGTWSGIPAGAALPAWMPAVSSGANLLLLIPAITIALIGIKTIKGCAVISRGESLCYVRFGTASLVLSLILLAASGVPGLNHVTDLTWFGLAQTELRIYGFFVMTIAGAIYYVLPRVAGVELFCLRPVKLHFWCGMIGTLLLTLPLAIGGIVQGMKMGNPAIGFADVTKSTLMFMRIGTMGEILIAIGNFTFLFSVTIVIVRHCRVMKAQCNWCEQPANLEPAGVKP